MPDRLADRGENAVVEKVIIVPHRIINKIDYRILLGAMVDVILAHVFICRTTRAGRYLELHHPVVEDMRIVVCVMVIISCVNAVTKSFTIGSRHTSFNRVVSTSCSSGWIVTNLSRTGSTVDNTKRSSVTSSGSRERSICFVEECFCTRL